MHRFRVSLALCAAAVVTAGLVPANSGIAQAAAVVPKASVSDITVVETDIGTGEITIPVTLDVPATATVKIKLAITGGTAAKKTDYTGKPTAVTIKKGQAAAFATLKLVGDAAIESAETLNLAVASVTGATIADSSGVVTVTDNDANGVSATPEIRAGHASVWEGNSGTRTIAVPVTLSRPSTTPVTLGYSGTCGLAAVTIPAGAVATTVNVTTTGNVADAADRIITTNLGLAAGTATLPVKTAETDVLDDDTGSGVLPVGGTVRASVQESGAQPIYPSYAQSSPNFDFPESTWGTISANGRYVAFKSNAYNLVDCDTNRVHDIFVKDILTGQIERVSVNSNGAQANRDSTNPEISADGRYVFFESQATNLVANDTVGNLDVFVHDRTTHTTQALINSASSTTWRQSASADARYVAFMSLAPLAGDLDPCLPGSTPDVNGNCDTFDVFVLDRTTGVIKNASNGQNGAPWGGAFPTISADGGSVAYYGAGAWVTNLTTGVTESVLVNNAGQTVPGTIINTLAISGDGRKVAFTAQTCSLGVPCPPAGATPIHSYLRDRDAGTTTLINAGPSGAPAGSGVTYSLMSLSSNGRYLLFANESTTLVGPACGSSAPSLQQLLQRDLLTGVTKAVATTATGVCPPADGGGWVMSPHAMSADGSYVAFESDSAGLVPNDTNGITDVFVKRLR